MSRVDEVLKAARSCIGTPFHHQGRLPGVGLDCGGLIVVVAQGLGVEYEDTQGYGREPRNRILPNLLDKEPCLVRVAPSLIEPGDILLFTFVSEPQHLAIYTGTTIIHAFEKPGKCVENRYDKFWSSRLTSAYRFK